MILTTLMALIKCRECGNNVSTEAVACPHCGAPQPATPPVIPAQHNPFQQHARPPRPGHGFLSGCFIIFLVIAGAIAIFAVVERITRVDSTSATEPPVASTPQPRDDLGLFISKYGPPDKEDSTENDDPRPPIVTRWIIYEAENVRATYVPDAKVGTPPPYSKWKLMGFQDSRDNSVLKPGEVVERLKGRQR